MTNERRPFWIWTGAAMACGLLLRLWMIRHFALIAGDSLVYGDIAKNLLQHGIYGFTESGLGTIQIRPTLIRLPGYPLFLASCFRIFGMENYRAVLYVQAAADLATCALTGALARRLFSPRAALAVLWLSALCPFTANYVAAPLTETLVLFTIAAALYTFARWQQRGGVYNPWLWTLAAALAASILLRPEQVLFAAAILGGMLWTIRSNLHPAMRTRPSRPIVAATLCILAPLAIWTARNERTFRVFQPLAPRYANDPGELAPLGFARWYRTWAIEFTSTADVYWSYSGDPIDLRDLPPRAFDAGSPAASADLRQRTVRLLADYNTTTGSTTAVIPGIDARFDALASTRIHAHPVLYYAVLPLARVLDMTLRPRTELMPIPLGWWRWRAHPRTSAISAALAALNLAYIAMGFAGFLRWRKSWRSLSSNPRAFHQALGYAIATAVLLRVALLLTLDNSEPRYTLEFFPILFLCAGALFAQRHASGPEAQPPSDNE
jgi:hypothetical protein